MWSLHCAFARFTLLAVSFALTACIRLPAGERLVHSEHSSWQTIIVSDSATRRCLRFDDGTAALNQSCQLLAEPQHLAFDYTRAMAAVLLLWQPPPQRVLLIGVGGGSIATALTVARPGVDIDAIEIDPAVLEVAQRYFGLVAGPRLRLHAADGRDFVAAARARGVSYDSVLLDAFDANGIPPALFSEEFLRDARAVLAPGGVFLANTIAGSASYVQETRNVNRVFARIYTIRLSANSRNRLIVAASEPKHLPPPTALTAGLREQAPALARIGIDPAWVGQLVFAGSD